MRRPCSRNRLHTQQELCALDERCVDLRRALCVRKTRERQHDFGRTPCAGKAVVGEAGKTRPALVTKVTPWVLLVGSVCNAVTGDRACHPVDRAIEAWIVHTHLQERMADVALQAVEGARRFIVVANLAVERNALVKQARAGARNTIIVADGDAKLAK